MNDKSIIPLALEYFDSLKVKYDKMFDKMEFIRFKKYPEKGKMDKLELFDEEKNLKQEWNYQILGFIMHNENGTKEWVWAWSVPEYEKESALSHEIKKYGDKLDEDHLNFLKQELISKKFEITNPIQAEIHISLACYLSKAKLIYKHTFDPSNLEKSKEPFYPIKSEVKLPYQEFYLVLFTPEKFKN